MQQFGQWVVSVTSVALITGILLSVLQEGAIRSLIRLLSGILLIITAVSPLTDVSIPDLRGYVSGSFADGVKAAEQGEHMAEEERRHRIKEALEEYICAKASEMGAQIRTSITLDDIGAPVSIRIIGNADKEIRQTIRTLITKELGIREEHQEWIGQTQKNP